MRETAFCPVSTTNVSVSGTSARGIITTPNIRLVSTADGFIKFGDVSVVATTNDCPLSANSVEYFNTDNTRYTHVAMITSGGTGILSITNCL